MYFQVPDDVRTRSIEKTLVPLISQINSVISSRVSQSDIVNCNGNCSLPQSYCSSNSANVGRWIASAVERFISIGEGLISEWPEVGVEMRAACGDVRMTAFELKQLTDYRGPYGNSMPDAVTVVSTARKLLSAVSRVLLIADKMCVKQITEAGKRVGCCLNELEGITSRQSASLSEFVAAFSNLGRSLVELAHMTGDRQVDLRLDTDREAVAIHRASLERATGLLLASSKSSLRHPESSTAVQIRDSMFAIMRHAVDRLDAVLVGHGSNDISKHDASATTAGAESDASSGGATSSGDSGIRVSNSSVPVAAGTAMLMGDYVQESNNLTLTPVRCLLSDIRSLVESEAFALNGESARRRFEFDIKALAEALQDFTDSAYTSHAQRECIIGLLQRINAEAVAIQRTSHGADTERGCNGGDTSRRLVMSELLSQVSAECRRLAEEVTVMVLEASPRNSELVNQLEAAATSGDQTTTQCCVAALQYRADITTEACRMLRNVAPNDPLVLDSNHILAWLRCLTTCITLCSNLFLEQSAGSAMPVSRVSRESFRSFGAAWCDISGRLLRLLLGHVVPSSGMSPASGSLQGNVGGAGIFAVGSGASVAPSPVTVGAHYQSSSALEMTENGNNGAATMAELAATLPRNYGGGRRSFPRQTGATSAASVRRSGSQPLVVDQLRQLKRHAANLAAMESAIVAFAAGNSGGPLCSNEDLFMQAQYIAEQSRTICRLVSSSIGLTVNNNGMNSIIEKALAATGRLEAIIAIPPPIMPSRQDGEDEKADRVIAAARATASTTGAVVNCAIDILSANDFDDESVGVVDRRSYVAHQQRRQPSNDELFAGVDRRRWHSRSAANLAD